MKIKKILISQPKPASDKSPYYDIAEKHGVEVVFRPFIKVEGLTSAFSGDVVINSNNCGNQPASGAGQLSKPPLNCRLSIENLTR